MNQALIDQYVAGRLDEQEAEAFETYCLTHPEFARQVEAEQLLRAGLSHVVRDTPGAFVVPRARAPAVNWRMALAASAVLAAGLAYFVFRPDANRVPILASAQMNQAGGPLLRLAMVRSAADDAPVLPQGRVRIEVVGLFDKDADYSVSLIRLSAEPAITVLEHQRAQTATALQVMLDADQLEAGAYTLSVWRDGSSDEPLTFDFLKK